MNTNSDEGTFDGRKSDDYPIKLQKTYEKMQANMNRVQKYVDLSKEVLSECCDKLQELHSQMAELKSMIEQTTANDTQPSSAASNGIQGKNELKRIFDQEITDGIIIEEGEISSNFNLNQISSNSSESEKNENQKKKMKQNPENETNSEFQETNNECVPGPSHETTSIRNNTPSHSQHEQTLNENETMDVVFCSDAVETALLNTEGVLSAQELKSFLYLSTEVEDPVNLARVSFTKDVEGLYSQLLNFNFLLKIANDADENERGTSNKNIEAKVISLIVAFKAAVENSDTRSQMPFRHGVAAHQRFQRFIM